jgi:peptidoglycan hydrolase CwlO-like protein
MKKLLVLSAIAIAVVLSSCSKLEPNKDVENCINKLNYFNTQFAEYYADGVISTEKNLGKRKDKSEYDNLKSIASEYYELVNKINSTVEEEAEKKEKGKKIEDYEVNYKKEVANRSADIQKATKLFEENLMKLEASKK